MIPTAIDEQDQEERRILRELERENTPDLNVLLAEVGYQYCKTSVQRPKAK